MNNPKKIFTATILLALSLVIGATSVRADSSTPLSNVANLLPITTTVSYDYDYATGALTPGTLVATELAFGNHLSTSTTDPASHSNGQGTFFGTAGPEHICTTDSVTSMTSCDTVVFTQSVCGNPPSCSNLSFGGFVVVHNFNGPLDQLTTLATQYYMPAPSSCGAGSPRYTLTTSAGNGHSIFVYQGPLPSFLGCVSNTWANPDSGQNEAQDSAGNRWDVSQLTALNPVLCPASYTTYTVAVTCANSLGLTINAIFLVIDSGYQDQATGGTGTQTVYFRSIQVNGVTRFP
jgi:hypothetical protein